MPFFTTCSALSAWLAKLMSITELGWPSAAARLISRPSPSTAIRFPLLSVYSSRNSRTVRFLAFFSSQAMSISTLKWPLLATMAPSFIRSKWGCASTSQFPVTVQKKSPIFAASRAGITR